MCYLLLKLSFLDSYYSKSPKTLHREVGQGQALTMSRSPQTSWKISEVGTKWGQSGTRGCRRAFAGDFMSVRHHVPIPSFYPEPGRCWDTKTQGL